MRLSIPFFAVLILLLDIACTKGTYIRSMARDFGERLGTVATLNGLRRTASGKFLINQAMLLEEFQAKVIELEADKAD